MFQDREDAGRRLAGELVGRPLRRPVVLAVPRGGVVVGAVLARDVGADLDVVLARKVRAPYYPELAVGAVAEDGSVHLDPDFLPWADHHAASLQQEIRHQHEEIARRRELLRKSRPAVDIAGRSVVVTDDGVATGSTLIAALRSLAGRSPYEVVVVVPVAAPASLAAVRPFCDGIVCLLVPREFRYVSDHYAVFREVDDAEVVALLEAAAHRPAHG